LARRRVYARPNFFPLSPVMDLGFNLEMEDNSYYMRRKYPQVLILGTKSLVLFSSLYSRRKICLSSRLCIQGSIPSSEAALLIPASQLYRMVPA